MVMTKPNKCSMSHDAFKQKKNLIKAARVTRSRTAVTKSK